MTLKNMDHWRKSLEQESPELAKRLARTSIRDDSHSQSDNETNNSARSDSTPSTPPNEPAEDRKSTIIDDARKPRSHSASEVIKGTIRKMRGTFRKRKDSESALNLGNSPQPQQSIFDLADSVPEVAPPTSQNKSPSGSPKFSKKE